MINDIIGFIAILATAYVFGKIISKIKLPAILGWLIIGIIFGPYLGELVSLDFINNKYYKIFIHAFECFAGVMIGNEINFQKLKSSGKSLIITTLFQSLGTFIVVSCFFLVTFLIAGKPLYLAFIFGGIALATAPAPALSIVKQYKTDGPVTRTLIPMAALDDIVGVIVFFTVISIVSIYLGSGSIAWWEIILMVLLPFVIGIFTGLMCSLLTKLSKNKIVNLLIMILFLLISVAIGVLCDKFIFGSSTLNYLLIGMAFAATITNLIPKEKYEETSKCFDPILSLSLIIVIVNLGMPLNYKDVAGAGLFTFIYILSRALGKIGGAFLGSHICKSDKNIQKYLGLTLLPHSGVSLVFTGIAVNTISSVDPTSATIIQGTIVAAAIINEIIAVILAKVAFAKAGELNKVP
ncbi:MAG: cation:proton antiporter [Bacilli bacterium]